MPRALAAALSRASGRCLRPVRGFTPSQSRSTLMSLRTRGPVMEKASATSSGGGPGGRGGRGGEQCGVVGLAFGDGDAVGARPDRSKQGQPRQVAVVGAPGLDVGVKGRVGTFDGLPELGGHLWGEGGKVLGGGGGGAEIVLVGSGEGRGGGIGDRIRWGAAALDVFGAEGSGFVGVAVPTVRVDPPWYGHIGGIGRALGDEEAAAESLVGGESDRHQVQTQRGHLEPALTC